MSWPFTWHTTLMLGFVVGVTITCQILERKLRKLSGEVDC